ncbi:MAG: DUF4139 domain-containing protein [Proteobacteria bacterium]|nr:DUF4139 domain-containing protein [Pseudomonadota bacterium]
MATASGDPVSPGPVAVAVTLYHAGRVATEDLLQQGSWARYSGLALITETREIDVPAGPAEIRFRGVAATMVPQTVDIVGLPPGTIERNFDYDLLSPDSLLAKSIGRSVHLVRTDPKTGRETSVAAIVRSGPNGAVLEIDGKLEALRCSGLSERLVFDGVPEGLTDTPTLSVRTNAAMAGHYRIRLSYIATGLNWSADYVAQVHGETLDLSGWLTLANFGETGFKQAPIYAVAGHANQADEDSPTWIAAQPLDSDCWPTSINWGMRYISPALRARLARGGIGTVQASPLAVTAIAGGDLQPEALGDLKYYALPEPTDLPAKQIKQVRFLTLHNAQFSRIFAYFSDPVADDTVQDQDTPDEPAILLLLLKNDTALGLGKPLPAGGVALTEPGPDGNPIFAAQATISDIPVGQRFGIAAGSFASVGIRQRVVAKQRFGKAPNARMRRTIDFEIHNSRDAEIGFKLFMKLAASGTRIVSETRAHDSNGSDAVWPFKIPAGQTARMRAIVETPE